MVEVLYGLYCLENLDSEELAGQRRLLKVCGANVALVERRFKSQQGARLNSRENVKLSRNSAFGPKGGACEGSEGPDA